MEDLSKFSPNVNLRSYKITATNSQPVTYKQMTENKIQQKTHDMSMKGLQSVFKSSVAYLSPIKLGKTQNSTDDLSFEHFRRLEQIAQVLKMKKLQIS